MLFWIKTVHTAIFLAMAACTFYLMYSGIAGVATTLTWIAIWVIALEGVVLLLNGGRCPLSTLAQRYGDGSGRVIDMFFPAWFLPWVIPTFGTMAVVGFLLVVVR